MLRQRDGESRNTTSTGFPSLHTSSCSIGIAKQSMTTTAREESVQDSVPLNIFQEASDVQRQVRVAIYHETNTTTPSYSYLGQWTTNVTLMANFMTSHGFAVTVLTADDIDGTGVLRTGLFDVFIILDNNPRERITSEVLDFWRGGGGILSFDSAASFLCYFGVLVPASVGNHGYGVYWTYQSSVNQNVTSRHPVTQSATIGDYFVDALDWATFDWSALQGFPYSSEYTRLTTIDVGGNWVSAIARDTVKGGRVVQTFGDGNPITPNYDQVLVDAINWLCPRPKARVVFDYTHHPYYGIDAGDPDLGYNLADRFAYWRDALVNRSYTVDKLFKSSEGNLTAENLALYDVLVINTPQFNFTSAEVSAVTNWVANGGGLIVLGDWLTFSAEDQNLNYLLSGFDMRLSTLEYTSGTITATEYEMHPTVEFVTSTYYQGGVYVNVTGDAYPLWYDGPNVITAAQEYGNGRVFLSGDVNFPANHILDEQNVQYSINLVNWMSSGPAQLLLYVDEPYSVNYYRTPVTSALNELGLNYYLTSDGQFLNLSLHLENWYLVIVDDPWFAIGSFYTEFRNYIASGGRFLMSGYQVDSEQSSPLWPMLGLQYSAELNPGVPLYIWNAASSIFNIPHDFGASNFTRVTDYGDEGDYLTVLGNATAIAGLSATPQAGNATIVVRNDGKTIYNGYLIDEFSNDLDDSTYADNYELWLNEIAFLLRPTINSPADVEYTEGTTGHSIVWQPSSIYPTEYRIERNGSLVAQMPWMGGSVAVNVDGLTNGTYTYTVTVWDRAGYTAVNEVLVTVTPTTTTTTGGGGLPLDPLLLIVIIGVAGVVLILIIVFLKKRGSS